jgi:hypothetical protein
MKGNAVNMTRTGLLSTMMLILIIGPSSVSSQSTGGANLSGTWKLNLAKSKLPKAPKIQSQTLIIVQDGLQIEFRYDTDGKESVEHYTANRKENVIREVREASSRIVGKDYWKGGTFVAETKAVFTTSSTLGPFEMMNTKDSFTLSGDGFSLTRKTQWEDGQSLSTYEKQ